MMEVSGENNLSETAFIVKEENGEHSPDRLLNNTVENNMELCYYLNCARRPSPSGLG